MRVAVKMGAIPVECGANGWYGRAAGTLDRVPAALGRHENSSAEGLRLA